MIHSIAPAVKISKQDYKKTTPSDDFLTAFRAIAADRRTGNNLQVLLWEYAMTIIINPFCRINTVNT